VAKNMMDDKTPQSIILQEIYKKYKKHNQQHLLSLTKQIEDLKENREELLKNKIKYQQIISAIDAKKRQYKKELLAKKRLLKELSKKEKKYKEELKRLFKRQSILRKTLAKLKILKMEKENSFREKAKEIEKRSLILKKLRKEREKKQINALKKGKDVKFEFVSLRNIKVFDSSYRSNVDKIYKYRGPKTISPLPGGKIIRRFGTYYDKLYNMKIFSPSIVIKAPRENSIVRNVLNGKVVLTGKNSMFGKFVIVEHNNGIYTIYSGLSKISPYVSNGKFVKKGAVLGKVRRKLHFQAYKDAKPLNPTKLIDI
ncbi:MAG: M23 family metallopeptidase, partial [Epsilonproteobacteria bacterium]|nr:M23 family metallopeptidase [Campylobacterota bacterium]